MPAEISGGAGDKVESGAEYLLLSLSNIHQMVMSLVLGKPGCELVRKRLAPAILLGLLVASTAMRSATQSNANSAADRNAADHTADHKPDRYYDSLPQETGDEGLKLLLRRLQTTARLMQTVAHPDDEDGGMLTLEARGQGVSTLLMTLNRGEGGQNKLGSNLFDGLGVLRTLELLAADRYYGVEQRFSRVADFGFSKTPEETFQKWQGHDIALGDMVRVVRTFRPDVLVARFSGTERDGHGHHQASAILTREAFRAAADPNRFPEQFAEGLRPWQPMKLYIGNVCGFGAASCDAGNYTLRLNTGTVDPALGTSYIQFAMKGLRHQLSQGSGSWTVEPGDRFTFYKLVDSVGESPQDKNKDKNNDGHEQSFFDGIDTSLPALARRLGDDEKKVLWLGGELASIAADIKQAADKSESNADYDSVADSLSKAVRSLDSVMTRLSQSGVGNGAKEDVLAILREKRDEAQAAVNLALGVSFRASVASPAEPGKTQRRAHGRFSDAKIPGDCDLAQRVEILAHRGRRPRQHERRRAWELGEAD